MTDPDPTTPLLATIQRQQLEIIELNKKLDAADQAAVAASAVEKAKDDQLAAEQIAARILQDQLNEALSERDRARHLVSQYEQGLRVHPNANNAAVREAKTLRMALRDLSIVITSLCENETR
jgi:hypothetical protein